MPYRRKKSSIWCASFTGPDGQRVRRSTGTTNKEEAKALEVKWKLETFRQRQWQTQPPRLFDELMLGYLKATAEVKRSADKDRNAHTTLASPIRRTGNERPATDGCS